MVFITIVRDGLINQLITGGAHIVLTMGNKKHGKTMEMGAVFVNPMNTVIGIL